MNLTSKMVKGLKIAHPTFLEEEYRKELLGLSNRIDSLTNEHLFNSSKFLKTFTRVSNTNRSDDIVDDLEKIIASIHAKIASEIGIVVASLSLKFKKIKQFTERSFKISFAHLNSKLLETDMTPITAGLVSHPVPPSLADMKKMWIEKNVRLIKSIPVDALSKVSDIVYESVKAGESTNSLARKLADVFELTRSRANLIARDQIGKLKGELSRYNDLSHGITCYIWSSCKDGEVRKSHAVMEGKICSWNNPDLYKNKITDEWKKRSSIGGVEKHVGADYQCRCTNILVQETLNYA